MRDMRMMKQHGLRAKNGQRVLEFPPHTSTWNLATPSSYGGDIHALVRRLYDPLEFTFQDQGKLLGKPCGCEAG